MFDPRDITVPIVQAPMAGGPSTPEMVAAVSSAGGFGFLGAGYGGAADIVEQIRRTRQLTSAPFGVNVFVPEPSAPSNPQALDAYRNALLDDAAKLGVTLPQVDQLPTSSAFSEILEALCAEPVAVVSTTFGRPPAELVGELHAVGTAVWGSVSTAAETHFVAADNVDAVVVQGPNAGGHRFSLASTTEPSTKPLAHTLREAGRATDLPLLASGGIASPEAVAQVRGLGAIAVQVGTAFLRADESGLGALQRSALRKATGPTVHTRAFTGRVARALANGFTRTHSGHAPALFPQVNHLVSPLRRGAIDAEDFERLCTWAGTEYHRGRDEPAAAVVERLASSV